MEKQIFVMRQKRRDPPIGMADGRLARDNPITANFLGMTAWDSRTGCDSFRRANHKAKSPGSPTDGMRRGTLGYKLAVCPRGIHRSEGLD